MSVIDVNSLVSQLMTVERKPLTALQTKITKNNSQISALGNIQNYMSQMQSALKDLTTSTSGKSFFVNSTTSSDEKVATLSNTSASSSGRYNLTVNQLADYDKYATSEANRLATKDATVGQGVMSFTVGDNNFSVTTTATTSLSQLVSYINSNSDNKSVNATIINDGKGFRLQLSSRESGASNAINLSVNDADLGQGDNSGLSRFSLSNMVKTSSAQDAEVVVDGLTMTSKTNAINDVINGGTLNIKSKGTVTIDQTVDFKATQDKIQKFVDAYNKVNTEMKNARSTPSNVLYGDSSLGQVQRSLQSEFNKTNSNGTYLSQMGISFDKNGTLGIDSTKLQAAMTKNPEALVGIFQGDGNLGDRLVEQTKNLLGVDGVFSQRKQSLNQSLRSLQQQQNVMSNKMDIRETALINQYSKLDTTLSGMMNTINQVSSVLT